MKRILHHAHPRPHRIRWLAGTSRLFTRTTSITHRIRGTLRPRMDTRLLQLVGVPTWTTTRYP